MPTDDVNELVKLLLLAMGCSAFPTNGLHDVVESGALSPVYLFLLLLMHNF